MTKNLLVMSNHPADKWLPDQKAGWNTIIHLPFLQVDPEAKTSDIKKIAEDYIESIRQHLIDHKITHISIQGEFSLTCTLISKVQQAFPSLIIVFPTTERIVKEEDGKKISIFKFVQWRELDNPFLP